MNRDDSDETFMSWLEMKHIFGAVFICLVIAGVIQAFRGHDASAATILGSAFVSGLLSQIDKVASFKGPGIEAKMRDLDATVTKAEEIMTRLRTLSVSLAKPIYQSVGNQGRAMPLIWEERFALLEGVEKDLEQLKVSPDQISKLREEVDKFVFIDIMYIPTLLLKKTVAEIVHKRISADHKGEGAQVNASRMKHIKDEINNHHREIDKLLEYRPDWDIRSIEKYIDANELFNKCAGDKIISEFERVKSEFDYVVKSRKSIQNLSHSYSESNIMAEDMKKIVLKLNEETI